MSADKVKGYANNIGLGVLVATAVACSERAIFLVLEQQEENKRPIEVIIPPKSEIIDEYPGQPHYLYQMGPIELEMMNRKFDQSHPWLQDKYVSQTENPDREIHNNN